MGRIAPWVMAGNGNVTNAAGRTAGFILALALGALVAGCAVHNPETDPLGDKLQKTLPGALSLTLGVPVSFNDPPSLVRVGDGFDVGLGDVRVQLGTTAIEAEIMFDPITGHVTPEADGYNLSLKMPEGFTLRSRGEEVGRGKIKGGVLGAHWSDATAWFSHFDLQLDGATVVSSGDEPPANGAIGAIRWNVEVSPDLRTLTRSRSAEAGELHIAGPEDKRVDLGWQSAGSNDEFHIPTPISLEEQKHVAETLGSFAKLVLTRPMDPATVSGALLPVLDTLLRLRIGDDPAGSGHSEAAITGLHVEGPGGIRVSFGAVRAVSDVSGKTINSLAGEGKLVMEGFSVSGVPQEVAGYLPSELHLDFSLSALPMYDLLQQLSRSTHGQLESGRPLKDMDLTPFKAPLSKAQTGLALERVQVEAPAVGLNGSASAHLDADARHGFVGDGTFTIRGLDEMVAALTKAADSDPKIKDIMPIFSLLMTLGKQTTVGGLPARQFDLSARADGALIVNNLDLGQLVQP
ncbi:DUF2125 domain-containing protein [Radicibacter daui]|uniref:DUF2125 domain-containing protein n=1 Tax=Radicibacter daui TaxID=3064829 RepID=UPI004046F566